MNSSPSLLALARQWPIVLLLFGSAGGAMYFAAYGALAWSLSSMDPGRLGDWRPVAWLYLAGLVTCLAVFLGCCLRLRRHRPDLGADARFPR